MPMLFVEAKFDTAADTIQNPKLTERMKESCKDLSWTTIDSGHWVALEKPVETNAAVTKWLAE
jgi:soluble epoxide hydrolase / lipid-phosphate phosphatase